jgi:hypothetical protein
MVRMMMFVFAVMMVAVRVIAVTSLMVGVTRLFAFAVWVGMVLVIHLILRIYYPTMPWPGCWRPPRSFLTA